MKLKAVKILVFPFCALAYFAICAVVVRSQISFGGPSNALSTPPPAPKGCTTPDGLEGQCIYLLECQTVMQLLRRKPLPQAVISHLRQSVCGRTRKWPDVCCPSFQSFGNPIPPGLTSSSTTTTTTKAPEPTTTTPPPETTTKSEEMIMCTTVTTTTTITTT